jgi:hypothetical protein
MQMYILLSLTWERKERFLCLYAFLNLWLLNQKEEFQNLLEKDFIKRKFSYHFRGQESVAAKATPWSVPVCIDPCSLCTAEDAGSLKQKKRNF